MKKPFFAMLMPLIYLTSAAAATEDLAILTASDINWISGEPTQLRQESSYRRWKKEFLVLGEEEARKYELPATSIRYSEIDVNNDGIKEIAVQEADWHSAGYAFALFKKKKNHWKAIEYHRGAFLITLPLNKSSNFIFIERSGLDYTSYTLKYSQKNGYSLVKKQECEIGFNKFWELNWSSEENTKAKARKEQPAEDPPFPRPRPSCLKFTRSN